MSYAGLPPVRTSTEVPLPAAAASPAASTRSAASAATFPTHRTRFVDNQITSLKRSPVQCFHSLCGSVGVVDLNETKSASFARKLVSHHIYAVHGVARIGEETLDIGFTRRIGKVPHKKSWHYSKTLLEPATRIDVNGFRKPETASTGLGLEEYQWKGRTQGTN